jgi:hypothetical protein
LQAPLQILRPNQERLGIFFARFDQTDGGVRRQGREEVFSRARSVKFE